ncbi:helix-turn-helix transcriptional regulator [Nostoc sp.]|uniref:helix-turn-helix transcriptional regulator n=1 Tax=Nostoc sp. TaxID=1180 RepID=UPI002FFCE859
MIAELDDFHVLTTLYQDILKATIPFIFFTTKVAQVETHKGFDLEMNDSQAQSCTLRKLLALIATKLEKQTLLKQDFEAYAQQVLEPLPINTANTTTQQSNHQSVLLLKEVFDFIEANYHQPITLDDVAQVVGYSPAYLTNLVRLQTGKSLYRWITHRRMAEAYLLLLETDQNLNQISLSLGYQNTASFCRQFRQINGKTPHVWRTICRRYLSPKTISAKQLISQSKEWLLHYNFQTI